MGTRYHPQNGYPLSRGSSSYCILQHWEDSTKHFWRERPDQSHEKTKKHFFFFPFKKKISQDNSDVSIPVRILGRHVQFRPKCCFWSEGISPRSGVQSPLHMHKHKCTAPQCCCPLGLTALPVGKPKPGSCQFQLRLGHVVLLKKACWLRGVLCFQSMGKKKKGYA